VFSSLKPGIPINPFNAGTTIASVKNLPGFNGLGSRYWYKWNHTNANSSLCNWISYHGWVDIAYESSTSMFVLNYVLCMSAIKLLYFVCDKIFILIMHEDGMVLNFLHNPIPMAFTNNLFFF
jgi:hypothetical protein